MLGVAFSNSYPLMVAACIFTLSGYLYLIYQLLEQGHGYRFFLMAALFVCVWNIIGFLQGTYYLRTLGIQDLSVAFSVLSLTVDVTVQDYGFAFAHLFSFVLICCLISEFQPLRNLEHAYMLRFLRVLQDTRFIHWAFLLFSLSTFVLLLAFGGVVRARGVGSEFAPEAGQLPWWLPIIAFVITTFPLLITRSAVYVRSLFSLPMCITFFGFLTALYINSILSRRFLIFYITALLYYSFIFVQPSRFFRSLNAKRKILLFLLVMVLLPLLYLLLTFFQYIRDQTDVNLNPLSFLGIFIDFLSSDQIDATAESAEQNLSFRPFLLYPMAAAIKMYFADNHLGFGYFQDIRDSTLNQLPRIIVGDKSNLLFSQSLVLQFFPFKDGDLPDSPMFDSFGAFGFYGLVIYPLFMAFVYCLHLVCVAFLARGPGALVSFILSFSALGRFATVSYAEANSGSVRELIIVPLSLIIIYKIFVFPFEASHRKRSHSSL